MQRVREMEGEQNHSSSTQRGCGEKEDDGLSVSTCRSHRPSAHSVHKANFFLGKNTHRDEPKGDPGLRNVFSTATEAHGHLSRLRNSATVSPLKVCWCL